MNKVNPELAKEIAGIRNVITRSKRTDYVTTYTENEYFNGKTIVERVLILRTRGCSWSYHSGCSMCGYWDDTNPEIGIRELENQVNVFLKEFPRGEVIKIFTSGSFFDPIEIDATLQFKIIEMILQSYEYLIVESRPEYIRKVAEKLKKYGGRVQVAIGLESTDPTVLKNSVNKNYDFEDFKEAASLLRENGISVRTYLLLKPPFMTEKEAIEDCIKSARDLSPYSDFISINPMNIQRGTLVEKLYKEGNYRPPWLWSVVTVIQALRDIGVPVVSLITASGKRRGAHNGHVCDKKFSDGIRKYSETLNYAYLDELSCDCRESWKNFTEIEEEVGTAMDEVILDD
ncbi:MAG: archaeosine biosynthesis radical SAM protein RaSEA [Thermoplasmatales archaeon]